MRTKQNDPLTATLCRGELNPEAVQRRLETVSIGGWRTGQPAPPSEPRDELVAQLRNLDAGVKDIEALWPTFEPDISETSLGEAIGFLFAASVITRRLLKRIDEQQLMTRTDTAGK